MISKLQTYYKFLSNHISLLILGLGSVVVFLCNIVFETKLNEVDYGEYSMLMTYIATIFNLGLLGLDKVFMRISDSRSNQIHTSKRLLIYCFSVGVILVVIGAYFYSYHFSVRPNTMIKILIISTAMVFGLFIYNVFRIRLQFIWSQLTLNVWKFSLGILALYFILNNTGSLESIYSLVFFISIFTTAWFIYVLVTSTFTFSNTKESFFKYWQSFAISIVLFIGLAYFDRYYINEKFGPEAFGNYFYLANIFLFPFHLLQSYVGFKKVVYFKKYFNWEFFKKQSMIVFGQSLVLAFVVLAFAYLCTNMGFIQVSFEEHSMLIGLFLLLGVIKVFYTMGESAISARISTQLFNKVNLVSFIVLLITLLIASFLVKSMTDIAAVMCMLWASLSVIYTFASKKLSNSSAL